AAAARGRGRGRGRPRGGTRRGRPRRRGRRRGGVRRRRREGALRLRGPSLLKEATPPPSFRFRSGLPKGRPRRFFGAIAQLGERLNGIQEVGGSTPPGSTNAIEGLAGRG